jgi:hypothetical protein
MFEDEIGGVRIIIESQSGLCPNEDMKMKMSSAPSFGAPGSLILAVLSLMSPVTSRIDVSSSLIISRVRSSSSTLAPSFLSVFVVVLVFKGSTCVFLIMFSRVYACAIGVLTVNIL